MKQYSKQQLSQQEIGRISMNETQKFQNLRDSQATVKKIELKKNMNIQNNSVMSDIESQKNMLQQILSKEELETLKKSTRNLSSTLKQQVQNGLYIKSAESINKNIEQINITDIRKNLEGGVQCITQLLHSQEYKKILEYFLFKKIYMQNRLCKFIISYILNQNLIDQQIQSIIAILQDPFLKNRFIGVQDMGQLINQLIFNQINQTKFLKKKIVLVEENLLQIYISLKHKKLNFYNKLHQMIAYLGLEYCITFQLFKSKRYNSQFFLFILTKEQLAVKYQPFQEQLQELISQCENKI